MIEISADEAEMLARSLLNKGNRAVRRARMLSGKARMEKFEQGCADRARAGELSIQVGFLRQAIRAER